jgi:hypothetical protein
VSELRKCPHGVNVGPLDDYGIPEDKPVQSTYCRVCNPIDRYANEPDGYEWDENLGRWVKP